MPQYAGLDLTFDLSSCTVLAPVTQNQLHLAPKRAIGWEFQVVVGSLRQTTGAAERTQQQYRIYAVNNALVRCISLCTKPRWKSLHAEMNNACLNV